MARSLDSAHNVCWKARLPGSRQTLRITLMTPWENCSDHYYMLLLDHNPIYSTDQVIKGSPDSPESQALLNVCIERAQQEWGPAKVTPLRGKG